MTVAGVLFVLVVLSGLATVGALFAGLIAMSRRDVDDPQGGRRSNQLMWWRVRLQFLTIVLILLWWLARGA